METARSSPPRRGGKKHVYATRFVGGDGRARGPVRRCHHAPGAMRWPPAVTLLGPCQPGKPFGTRELRFGFSHVQNEGVRTRLVEAM